MIRNKRYFCDGCLKLIEKPHDDDNVVWLVEPFKIMYHFHKTCLEKIAGQNWASKIKS